MTLCKYRGKGTVQAAKILEIDFATWELVVEGRYGPERRAINEDNRVEGAWASVKVGDWIVIFALKGGGQAAVWLPGEVFEDMFERFEVAEERYEPTGKGARA